jgi:hypothetical protein
MGIVTEECSGINQTLSIFLSFMISFLVISFTKLELVIGLASRSLFRERDYTVTVLKYQVVTE